MSYEIVIRAAKASKRFGSTTVLDGLDLELPRGAVYGLVGRNGVGKTTLIRCLLGLEPIDAGDGEVLGKPSLRLDCRDFSRIGYQAHGMALFPELTLADHIAYFAPGYPSWDASYAERLVDRLEVPRRVPAKALSSGDRQKAGLVLALAHRPELLVLDEPAANLDAFVRRAVIELLVEHVADGGCTILIASHILTDLERFVDRVGFLRDGRIALERPLDALKETVVKLRLTFPERVPPDLRVPHELAREVSGRDLVLTVSELDESFLATLDGRTEREVVHLGLEDIFIALTGGAERKGGAS